MAEVLPVPISSVLETSAMTGQDYFLVLKNKKLRQILAGDTLQGIAGAITPESVLANPGDLVGPAVSFPFVDLGAALGIPELQAQILQIFLGLSLPTVEAATKAELDLITDKPLNTFGLVYADPTPGLNGIYQWDGVSWVFQSASNYATLAAQIVVIEAKIADLTAVNVEFGRLAVSDGEGSGSVNWTPMSQLGDQPIRAVDWTDTGEYQKVGGPPNAGAPGDFITASIVGSALQLESDYIVNPWFFGAETSFRVLAGRSFSAKFEGVTMDPVHAGIGLGFQTPAPTLGPTYAVLDASAEVITARYAGAVIVYERDAITSAGVTIQASKVIDRVIGGTEVVEFTAAVDSTGTKADCRIIASGQQVCAFQATGLTPGMYVIPVARNVGANQIMKFLSFTAKDPSISIPASFFINAGAVAHGTGKPDNPWKDFRDVVATDGSDPNRADYRLFLRGGTYAGALPFDGKKIRRLEIVGAPGEKTVILGGISVPSGTGAFTQPDAGGNPNVWKWPLPTGASAGGSFMSLHAGQANGRTGSVIQGAYHGQPYTTISRQAANYAIASLNSEPRPTVAFHSIGAHANSILFNPGAGVDPNTRSYYWTAYSSVLVPMGASVDDFTMPIVILRNLIFAFPMAGPTIERGFLEAESVDCYGMLGNGFQLNESFGKIYGGVIDGGLTDNINMQGGLSPALTRKTEVNIFGTRLLGCSKGVFLSGVEVAGDNISNHQNHMLNLHGVEMRAAAKSSVELADTTLLSNCLFSDAVGNGIGMADLAGNVVVHGGTVELCGVGVQINTVVPDHTNLFIDNLHFRNNLRDVRYLLSGGGTANSSIHRWYQSGTPPGLANDFGTAVIDHRAQIFLGA